MENKRRKRSDTRKTGRLSLRLADDKFVEQVHNYAKRHNTSVNAIVEAHLRHLLTSESRTRTAPEVEQI